MPRQKAPSGDAPNVFINGPCDTDDASLFHAIVSTVSRCQARKVERTDSADLVLLSPSARAEIKVQRKSGTMTTGNRNASLHCLLLSWSKQYTQRHVRRAAVPGVLAGLLGCIFGVMGIFAVGFVFVPLAAVCAAIGLVRGLLGRCAAGVGTSLLAGVLSVFGFILSPSLWLLTATVIAAGSIITSQPSQSPLSSAQHLAAVPPPRANPPQYRLAMPAPASPSSPGRAMSGNVPFVGCASDGQTGPVPAPVASENVPTVPEADIGQLAYYGSSALAVLAPKSWRCFGTYGSAGSTLIVAPSLSGTDDLFRGTKLMGPAIVLSRSSGDTSGRFTVASVAARVFPSAWPFVKQVMDMNLRSQDEFRFEPYPADKLIKYSSTEVEFTTPPESDGFGTDDLLAKDGLPVSGILILVLQGGSMDLVKLAIKLPAELRNLTPAIIATTKNDRGFIIIRH